MTPAEELRAAATKLREKVAAAPFSSDAAEAYALVLDDTAKRYDNLSWAFGTNVAKRIVRDVLVTARVINGTTS